MTYDVTAGHCGNGTFVQNGSGYGVTHQISYTSGGNDFQTITTFPNSSTGQIFVGGVNSSSNLIVTTVGITQEVGEKSCFDGYAFANDSDEWVGSPPCVTIQKMNQCFTPPGAKQTCGLNEAYDAIGDDIAEPGDSGGPVFNYTTGGVQALGIINIGASCRTNTNLNTVCTKDLLHTRGDDSV